jgi:hypothetical protein
VSESTESKGSTGERNSSPVEDFLDEVLVASTGAPARETRHLLTEVEQHLRDAVSEAVAHGSTRVEAERDAVSRFGPAAEVAHQEAKRRSPSFGALLRAMVGSGLLLGGLAGVGIGFSAIVTAVMGVVGGKTFIVNISSHTYLAPSDCARWLANDPAAHSCYNAALADWATEAVAYRAALGVLGVVALVAFVFLRRRWSARHLVAALPRGVVDAVALTVFTAAGVWLAAVGIDALAVSSGRGAGQGLGTAPAMILLAAVFGLRLLQDLRDPSTGDAATAN